MYQYICMKMEWNLLITANRMSAITKRDEQNTVILKFFKKYFTCVSFHLTRRLK